MDTLLFLNSQIWWDKSTLMISLLGASILGLVFVVYRFRKIMKPFLVGSDIEYTFIGEHDSDWEQKTLSELKSYIMALYMPKKTEAHTSEEIASYLRSNELQDIITKLEHAEYGEKVFSFNERKKLNNLIASLLPDIKLHKKG